jgi:hypothetical protein
MDSLIRVSLVILGIIFFPIYLIYNLLCFLGLMLVFLLAFFHDIGIDIIVYIKERFHHDKLRREY